MREQGDPVEEIRGDVVELERAGGLDWFADVFGEGGGLAGRAEFDSRHRFWRGIRSEVRLVRLVKLQDEESLPATVGRLQLAVSVEWLAVSEG